MAATRREGCALCGAVQRERPFEKDGYPICRCRSCGLVQADRALTSTELRDIYGEDYFAGTDAFEDYLTERPVRLECGRRLARLLAGVAPGGRLLDVGCAAGFFLAPASEYYEVTGVEPGWNLMTPPYHLFFFSPPTLDRLLAAFGCCGSSTPASWRPMGRWHPSPRGGRRHWQAWATS